MTKYLVFLLTLTLLVFPAIAQAQVPQQKPDARGSDYSGGKKKTKLGKLPRKSEIVVLEERLKYFGSRVDPRISGGGRLPYRLEYADILRKSLARMDQLHGGLVYTMKEHPGRKCPIYENCLFPPIVPYLDNSREAKVLMRKWIPKYKEYLKKKSGTKVTLSPEQLKQQVWHWLVPREKAELKARIKRYEEGYDRDLKSYDKIRDRLAKKKAELAARKATVDDKKTRKEDIKKEKVKSEEPHTARRQSGGGTPRPRSENDRVVEADEGGMLTGKALRPSDLEGCGSFLKFNWDENMGFASTSCPGLTGGRIATQADYLTYCNSFPDFSGPCAPPGSGTEKMAALSGIRGMPFSVFCLGLHFNILASQGDVYNSTVKAGKLASIFKYDNNSRKLECYYVSFAQSKALRDQFKNPGKVVDGADASTAGKPTKTTTTSIENPDDTVTTTNKGGKVVSEETVGRSPASASSTDIKTGVTTKSVRNSDGTRTVTKTDKNGSVLSRETVGNSPDSASSTDLKTNVTVKSVTNPDGTRTVTTTGKDGIVLSVEKVR